MPIRWPWLAGSSALSSINRNYQIDVGLFRLVELRERLGLRPMRLVIRFQSKLYIGVQVAEIVVAFGIGDVRTDLERHAVLQFDHRFRQCVAGSIANTPRDGTYVLGRTGHGEGEQREEGGGFQKAAAVHVALFSRDCVS